jgi:hypothetical protein
MQGDKYASQFFPNKRELQWYYTTIYWYVCHKQSNHYIYDLWCKEADWRKNTLSITSITIGNNVIWSMLYALNFEVFFYIRILHISEQQVGHWFVCPRATHPTVDLTFFPRTCGMLTAMENPCSTFNILDLRISRVKKYLNL